MSQYVDQFDWPADAKSFRSPYEVMRANELKEC